MCTLMLPTAIHNQEHFACRSLFSSSMPRRGRDQDAASDVSMRSRATSHEDNNINTDAANETHSLTNDATDDHMTYDHGPDPAHQEHSSNADKPKQSSGIWDIIAWTSSEHQNELGGVESAPRSQTTPELGLRSDLADSTAGRTAHTAGHESSPATTTCAVRGDLSASSDQVDQLKQVVPKKRPVPSRTLTGLSALMPPRKKSQRQRTIKGGFPCREKCGKCFDRECDERKHFERAHLDMSYWPHECLHCPKKSPYPKDIWRHLAQTHGLIVPSREPKSLRQRLGCPCCSQPASDWLEAHNLTTPPQAVQQPIVLAPKETSSQGCSPNMLWILTNAIIKLRRLSRMKKPEKFIMVTADRSKFVQVNVSNVVSTKSLVQTVSNALGDEYNTVDIAFNKYSGRQILQQAMDVQQTLDLIMSAADAEGSLKLCVNMPSSPGQADTVHEMPATGTTISKCAFTPLVSDSSARLQMGHVGEHAPHSRETSTERGSTTESNNLPPWEISKLPNTGLSRFMAVSQRRSSMPPLHKKPSRTAARIALRAHSVPPKPNVTNFNTVGQITTHAGTSDGAGGDKPESSLGQCASSGHERFTNHTRTGNGKEKKRHDDDGDSWPNKHPRGVNGTKSVEAKLPCIFFVGPKSARHQHEKHRKKHAYISGLLRHLESHGFYACCRCLKKFENRDASTQHSREKLCVKECSNAHCKRYCAADSARSLECDCITTPEEQWEILFSLQYPDAAVPNVFDSQLAGSALENTPLDGLDLDADSNFGEFWGWDLPPIDVGPSEPVSHESLGTMIAMPSSTVDPNATAVRQRMQSLEDQLSRAQEDARKRGVAMELLFDALKRADSSYAQPESSIFKAVQLIAPGVLTLPEAPVTTTSMAPSSSNTSSAPTSMSGRR